MDLFASIPKVINCGYYATPEDAAAHSVSMGGERLSADDVMHSAFVAGPRVQEELEKPHLPAWGQQPHPAEDQRRPRRQQGDSDGDSNADEGKDALEGISVLCAVAEAGPITESRAPTPGSDLAAQTRSAP